MTRCLDIQISSRLVTYVDRLDESLWWDGHVHDVDNYGNDHALLALSAEELNVDGDSLSTFKGAYSSCNYLFDEQNLGWKRRDIVK